MFGRPTPAELDAVLTGKETQYFAIMTDLTNDQTDHVSLLDENDRSQQAKLDSIPNDNDFVYLWVNFSRPFFLDLFTTLNEFNEIRSFPRDFKTDGFANSIQMDRFGIVLYLPARDGRTCSMCIVTSPLASNAFPISFFQEIPNPNPIPSKTFGSPKQTNRVFCYSPVLSKELMKDSVMRMRLNTPYPPQGTVRKTVYFTLKPSLALLPDIILDHKREDKYRKLAHRLMITSLLDRAKLGFRNFKFFSKISNREN